ncbi:MAG TPA: protoglobin domain-containing protein [Haliangiales bacterium]|nr:protoglobin domain-containing protein [Haliangiales bacterium]
METLFEELKRYVHWSAADEDALRAFHDIAEPDFERIADVFYRRILEHEGARTALEGGESQVGRLKVTLRAWMDSMLLGPWDEAYYERRARIGRMHVRIALPQHYMFGAMDVVRSEMARVIDRSYRDRPVEERAVRDAVGKILDLELAVMLHTYREDLIAQQARHERLATFGQLVGSIGHELRNPLGVIESSLYILRRRVDEERARKHMDRIGAQVAIANQIISDLLDLIRDRPLQLERVRPSELIDAVLAAVKRPPEVLVSVRGVAELPEIEVDASKLRQVFVNLIDNAVDAVGAAGEVHVVGAVSAGEIVVAVEDSGPGVDATIRARLFEPLITTKAKGIGLGLPLVRRIVERHGGTVAYAPPADAAGRLSGARFVVRLPLGGARA